MKLGSLFTFIFLILSAAALADGELNCAGMKHPAHMDEYDMCIRAKAAITAKENGVDCIHCMEEQEVPETSGVIQALSAAVQPAAYIASLYAQASFQHKSQKVWADAYAEGFSQCTNRYNSYVDYYTATGANPITSAEYTALGASCNGHALGGYAGFGGYMGNMYGGFSNPYLGMGYSPGFMSVYGGPYAMMGGSMYNNGMVSGSMGISGTLTGSTTLTSSTSGIAPAFSF